MQVIAVLTTALTAFTTGVALSGCAQVSPRPTHPSPWPVSSEQASTATARADLDQNLVDSGITSPQHGSAMSKITMKTGDTTFSMTLAGTPAAHALASKVETGAISVDLQPYGGFEAVGALPWSLPASDTQITTAAGDVMLYQGNQIVVFYGSHSWSYTPLGKIDAASAQDLKNAFAKGGTKVIISEGME